MEWRRDWLDGIRRRSAEGRTMSRVRIVSRPATDYVKFSYRNCADNIAAGEDIRYLARADAADLPPYDFWLFDSTRLVRMHFTDANEFLGAELVDNAEAVADHVRLGGEAWSRATRYPDFKL